MPSRDASSVLSMVSMLTSCTPVLEKVRPCRAGRAIQLMVSTLASLGKLRVERMVKPFRSNRPPISSRSGAERDPSPVTLSAMRSASIIVTPARLMLSVVPLSMAMLPLMVEQLDRAMASPEFWRVMVLPDSPH